MNSRALSSVMGIILLTLVIFFLATTVFYSTFLQSASYSEDVKEINQEEAERRGETLVTSHTNFTVPDPHTIKINTTVCNEGAIAAKIVTAWVSWIADDEKQYAFNNTLDINIKTGERLPVSITVAANDVNSTCEFSGWLITDKGNSVVLEALEDVIEVELALGIGSVSMEFATFRYYRLQQHNILGPENYSYAVPMEKDIVFGIILTNLDPSRQDINLSYQSCFWLSNPTANSMAEWDIAKVVNGTLVKPFDFQILEWSQSTLVYFYRSIKPPAAAVGPNAVNILLYGKIGATDYGQNIPFISLYLYS